MRTSTTNSTGRGVRPTFLSDFETPSGSCVDPSGCRGWPEGARQGASDEAIDDLRGMTVAVLAFGAALGLGLLRIAGVL